jgi:hypothetical protein
MTHLAIEHFGMPSSRREARGLSYTEDSALDGLATRTVWCASGLSSGERSARAMRELNPVELRVEADEPLLALAEALETMLRGEGRAPASLGPADRELFSAARANSETLVGEQVRADDVVVLDDPLTAALAEAVRERGAHVVWYLEMQGGPARPASMEARLFLRDYTEAVHARVTAWRGGAEQHVVAVIPSVNVLAVKEAEEAPGSDIPPDRLLWASTLAEVISTDRAETVGGTLHARPAIATR